jgi:hypothetical protein
MNSWSNPETIISLIGAFTALVVAVFAGYHSIVTRSKVETGNIAAMQARAMSTVALNAVKKVGFPSVPNPVTESDEKKV